MMKVSKEFSFEAAHSLPHLPETHKCHHLHGHSYRVVVGCSRQYLGDDHWVVDYAGISKAMGPVIAALDHKNINEVIRDVPTTAEHLAVWIAGRLRAQLPSLSWVEIKETEKTSVVYEV